MSTIYTFNANTLEGQPISLEQFKGQVLLIVNTASKCGFTPQFEGLEELHQKLNGQGFSVLGFPSNQFAKQDPGSNAEIGEFCQRNYGVSFPMFEKIDVNGSDAHPLYKHLTKQASGVLGSAAIKWNFTKFLISKDGRVVKRYGSITKPMAVLNDVMTELAK